SHYSTTPSLHYSPRGALSPLRSLDVRGALRLPGDFEAALARRADRMPELNLQPVVARLLVGVGQHRVAFLVPEPADRIFLFFQRQRVAEVPDGDRRRIGLGHGGEYVLRTRGVQ